MGRLGTAFRAFFRALGDASFAEQVANLLDGATPGPPAPGLPAPSPPSTVSEKGVLPEKKAEPPKKPPGRNDALNLLAALQREARLVDFIKEPLAEYSDAQVGAAVRDVHRDCGAVLERLFSLRPLLNESEEATVNVPAGFDTAQYRLTGNVAGQPPYHGTLRHHGWKATHVNLPQWTGEHTADAAMVIAPAEVELR